MGKSFILVALASGLVWRQISVAVCCCKVCHPLTSRKTLERNLESIFRTRISSSLRRLSTIVVQEKHLSSHFEENIGVRWQLVMVDQQL